jgi:hypothetical protein
MNLFQHVLAARWKPAEQRIYKPQHSGTGGSVLKIQLRVEPETEQLESGPTVIKHIKGGLFFELVPQGLNKTANGDPTFDYESPNRVIAMLGMPDITKLLVAFRYVRLLGKEIPAKLRKDEPTKIQLFHKTPGETKSSCIITWSFAGEGSTLELSRSKTQRQRINLALDEELIVTTMLQKALDAYTDVGF